MKKCHIAYLVCAALVAGTGVAAAAPATLGHATHVVRPGQSIQKAVDAAQPGDTVLVAAGTYHESVRVSTPGLTLRGVGQRTVIEPATAKAAKTADSCSGGGNGICVTGTKTADVKDVTVAALTVKGFSRAGVFGVATDGMTVRDVHAVSNKVWGIAQERSVRGVLRDNHVHGSGDAGIFLANTITEEAGAQDTKGTVIARNHLKNNRIGVTVRRLRDLTVAGNDITGNCAAVFVVGDENKPRAGALSVRGNRIVANNKSCPATDRLPAIQGAGVVLTGAEDTEVTRNLITDNAGKSPMSGGVVLYKSMVGAKNERNRVSGNFLERNAPADLVNGDTGKGNTFTRNSCRASKPAGLC